MPFRRRCRAKFFIKKNIKKMTATCDNALKIRNYVLIFAENIV